MGNIPPCGFFNRQQSAEQNRLFLCSVRPGLLSEMENNSLNVGRDVYKRQAKGPLLEKADRYNGVIPEF